nr:plastocyanin/azurin family copper-binding protein [Micromonospora sp. DSM 115978]
PVAVPPPADDHGGNTVTYGPTPVHVPPPAPPPAQVPPPPPAPPAPPAPIADGRMTIANFAFSPSVVTFRVGQRVVVTNNDSAAHTWTSSGGGFDTGLIQPGGSATVTLTRVGTFGFLCSPHPNMTGTVTVTA